MLFVFTLAASSNNHCGH